MTGADPQCYGWDKSQFQSREEIAILTGEVSWYREHEGAFNEDGLIFFVPEMNLRPWDYPKDSIMRRKFFRIHLPWEDGPLGMDWTKFYNRVKEEFGWRCFQPGASNSCYVFYKTGEMPDRPLPRSKVAFVDHIFLEQGGIYYWDMQVWENVNSALAFRNDNHPFLEGIANRQILLP